MAISESFTRPTAQNVTPSYLYVQYSDDDDLQAFVDAYNEVGQLYLDWFNNHPLAIYTDHNINGQLLDWVGRGIYGTPRPAIGSFKLAERNALNTVPMNYQALNTNALQESGKAHFVSDDIYKRTLTWLMYAGDGRQMSIEWLRRRVARFAYGSNGKDFAQNDLGNVSIQPGNSAHTLTISVPKSTPTQAMQDLIGNNTLPLPFQLSITVNLK